MIEENKNNTVKADREPSNLVATNSGTIKKCMFKVDGHSYELMML